MKNLQKQLDQNKSLQKSLSKLSYYNTESFINDTKRYIKAIKEGRVICNIKSVSQSGMSRQIKFVEVSKCAASKQYRMYNFFAFFKATGHTPVNDSDYFRINGCGMDMIFHTNYSIIHGLSRLGFINKADCDKLAQLTPSVI